jgi:hypothetical protein
MQENGADEQTLIFLPLSIGRRGAPSLCELSAALVEEAEDPVGQCPITSFIGGLIPLRAYRGYAHWENTLRGHRFNRMTILG